jgi:hypothetical protein
MAVKSSKSLDVANEAVGFGWIKANGASDDIISQALSGRLNVIPREP